MIRSLTACMRWIANPPDPVKAPATPCLRHPCSACRACCVVVKFGLRRTIFIYAGVQLALAICGIFPLSVLYCFSQEYTSLVFWSFNLIKTLFGILYLQSSNFINTILFHILGRSKACFFLEKATEMILI